MGGMDMSAMPGMTMAMPKAKPATRATAQTPMKTTITNKTKAKTPAKAAPSSRPHAPHPMVQMDHRKMDMNQGTMDMPHMDHGAMDMRKGTADMAPMDHHAMDMHQGTTDMSHMDHGAMDMSQGTTDMSHMDHSTMGMSQGTMDMPSMDHGAMAKGTMKMGRMQGGSAPADARSPDYSQGRDFGPIAPPEMMGSGMVMSVLFNQLEVSHSADQTAGNYDVEAWLGSDWNRAVLKAEGTIASHQLADARTELLWRKPVDIFWNSELGLRQDSGAGRGQTWLALGLNGISPYWLELGATAYVADDSRAALRLEATYDWRITQRLILQPTLEANLYSKNDPARDIGKGLSDLQAGLRLHYEVTRQFAPYIGVETRHQYGKTAELLRARHEQVATTTAVAGLRVWF